MIELRDVKKVFETASGPVAALSGVNLRIGRGDIYGIIGMSGAGKSTLVRCINFLERPTAGRIFIDGQELAALKNTELRKLRQSVSMVFQQFNLLTQRTALKNVQFPLEIAGVGRREARERALELLNIVGLADRGDSYPSQLSGGQKQRVAIARALALNPKVLLSDEATSALDPVTTRSILELLRRINREMNITIVVITHQMNVIREICRHVAVMNNAQVVEEGPVEKVLFKPENILTKRLFSELDAKQQEVQPERRYLLRLPGERLAETLRGVSAALESPAQVSPAEDGRFLLRVPDNEEAIFRMCSYLTTRNIAYEEEWLDVELPDSADAP